MHSKSHSEYKCEYIRHGVITYNLLNIIMIDFLDSKKLSR